jgi:hypothetical protein
VTFSLAFNGPSTVTTSSGQNAVFPLLLTAGPAVAGAKITLTCTGAPVNSSCNITPSAIAVDGNATTVAVTVLTGVPNLAQTHKTAQRVWLALVLPVGLLGLRRRRLAGAAVLCILLVASGCGAGRLIPASGGPGSGSGGTHAVTPNGTYTVVVTGTSAGLSRSVNLTLVVQ